MVAKGLPADLKPLADVLGVDEEKVKTLYTDELTEFKYQILWRQVETIIFTNTWAKTSPPYSSSINLWPMPLLHSDDKRWDGVIMDWASNIFSGGCLCILTLGQDCVFAFYW